MKKTTVDVDSKGFLSQELNEVLKRTALFDSSLRDALPDLLRVGRELSSKCEVARNQATEEDRKKISVLVLYVRLLDVSESIYVLSSLGARQETKALFRVFLDAYFVVARLLSDDTFPQKYFQIDNVERLKLLRVAAKDIPTDFFEPSFKELISEEVIAELDKVIKDERQQAFNSYSNAIAVGCEHMYNLRYRILGASVHSGPRAFIDYLDEEESTGIINGLSGAITQAEAGRFSFDMGFYLVRVIEGVAQLFDLTLPNEYQDMKGVLLKSEPVDDVAGG